MGNHYEYHLNPKPNYFLPMLCSKSSFRDVKFPKWEDPSSSSSSSSSAAANNEPLSPKIGCLGQIKRSNRITNCSSDSHKLTLSTVKYFKLKKIFSGKNLTAPTKATNNASSAVAAVDGRSVVCRKQTRFDGGCRWERIGDLGLVNIGEMDPPLPVIKKGKGLKEEGEMGNNLWKRRSGGVGLKTLEIHHHIQVSRNQLLLTTV